MAPPRGKRKKWEGRVPTAQPRQDPPCRIPRVEVLAAELARREQKGASLGRVVEEQRDSIKNFNAEVASRWTQRRSQSRASSTPPPLGSVWNQAGTWEEKNLNSWANSRIKISLEFPTGKASIDEVSKCSGDAFQVTVRNKKRVGYNYELSLRFRGEWLIKEENKKVKGHLDIPEFSFGELDDLELQVRFSDDKGLTSEDKTRICKDLKSFLTPIQEKMGIFEEELKGR